jgi:methyl-accepting chemotaxis protein
MKWYLDLKIATKLISSFVIVSIIAAGIGYIGIKNLGDMAAQSDQMYSHMTVPITQLGSITESFQRIRINTRDMLVAPTPGEMNEKIDKIADLRVETSKSAALLEKTLVSQEAKDMFKAFMDARALYGGDIDKLVAFAKAGKKAEAWTLMRGDGFKSATAEQAAIDKLKEKKLNDAEVLESENSADAKAATTLMLGSLAFGVLIAMSLGIFIARVTSRPVKEVVQSIDNADLNMAFNSDRKDEVGDLQRSFDRFVKSIKETLLQVAEASAAVASASSEISSSTEQMAAGSQEQTSQAGEVASAVEEMTKTIVENSKNAANTADTAKTAKAAAEQGDQVVDETVAGMKRIAEVVRKSAATVQALGKSSDQIGEIIGVIDDIADQTNLLALNAAIEAARAGEQGRGFAVVADEVRKLAERTTKATKEIASMIKTIQTDTAGAVTSMGEGTRQVDEGIKLADKAGDSLKEIVGISQKVTDMVAQIAAASEQQSSASEQISKNVEAISTVTGETAQGTQQIARAAEDLNRLTENLQQYIDKFKLSKDGGSTTGAGHNGKKPGSKAKLEKSHVAVRENGSLVAHE